MRLERTCRTAVAPPRDEATAAATASPTRSQSSRSEFHRVEVRHGDRPGQERRREPSQLPSRSETAPSSPKEGIRGRRSRFARKRLPTTRDPQGSIEAMSTVANGHSPTDRACAGRRERRPGLGRRRRPARATPPPTPPSPDGERGGERSCPGPNAASKNRTCQPASRRCHPVTDAPLFAGHGRRSSRNRSAARDARRPSNEDPSRRLTPAECNRCTGPQAGAGASSAEARAPRATPPAGAGSAARHDGTGRPETRRKEPRAVCPGHGTGTRIRPLPPTAARPET